MKRPIMTTGVALLAAAGIAACGSSSGGGGTTAAAPAATGAAASSPASASTKTVALRQVSGIGKVLVNSAGMGIYVTDADTGGKIACTKSSGCTSFWKPVMVSSGKPGGAGSVGKLGTAKRPDGTTQLTIDGRPVYTFAPDSPGKLTGNDYTDHFAGQQFVWHALAPGGKPVAASSAPAAPATTNSGGSSGYGY